MTGGSHRFHPPSRPPRALCHRRNSPGNGARATGNYNHRMKPLLVALALLAATPTTAHAKIDFIENDYATAVARAKARNVPIFVEAWAPW